MAIAQFNPLSKPLRGKVGGLVFKHYATQIVVTRAPTFSGKWSTAQQDGRKRFALASAYARTVCADPVLRAKYALLAVQRGNNHPLGCDLRVSARENPRDRNPEKAAPARSPCATTPSETRS